jgi:dihydroneopterin aldolase
MTTRGHRLSLRGLEVEVRLGCTGAERAAAQRVAISLAIGFHRAPQACTSDDLAETVCMQALAEALAEVCRSREYALVEHLSQTLLARALELLPADAECELEVVKLQPPIAGLTRGFAFRVQGRAERSLGYGWYARMRSLASGWWGSSSSARL